MITINFILNKNIKHLLFLLQSHSFGYDCKKRANLNILDAETLIFSAGNMVQILNIKTKKQIYLETISGGAVGAIAVKLILIKKIFINKLI